MRRSRERRIAGEGESTATLATAAARKALAAAELDANDLDLVVCGTVTPEMAFPSTACFVAAALGLIKAKTLVVPFSHDMFFPPDDCEAEQRLIPNSKFRVVESLWAHFAMFCMTTSDREQIDACIRDLLNETA